MMSEGFMFDDVNLGGDIDLGGDTPIDISFLDLNDPVGSGFFDATGNLTPLGTTSLLSDPELLSQFKVAFPEDAAILDSLLQDPETKKLLRQQSTVLGGENAVGNIGPQGDTNVPGQSVDATGLKGLADKVGQGIKDLTGISGTDALRYAAMIAAAKMAKDDAEAARKEARGAAFKSKAPVTATRQAYKGTKYAAQGGLMSLAQGGKTSLPPRYLNGHSDGMADKVPAQIDNRRPAALSDGEFVIPADVVSHLGNGNSSAGAKRLYEMMDRIRHARTGNPKQGKQINPDKFLPR
jgi:hypothetical protein